MFEIESNAHRDNPVHRMDDPEVEDYADEEHELDSPDNQELFEKLMGYYQQELDRQYDNRVQMAIDEDFYDHIQWDEEDAAALRARGQAPLVYNVLAQSINWIIGSEKRGRVDFKVLPRRKDDAESAERKTQILKYLSDANKSVFHRSRAFEDAVKVGIGWLEDGAQGDDDGEPIYCRYEGWRNMLWDSAAVEMDLSDARYIVRAKWVDEDVALAIAPERASIIRESVEDGQRFGYDGQYADEVMDQHEVERETSGGIRTTNFSHRKRVRLVEIWYRKPERVQRFTQGAFAGDVYDPEHPAMAEFAQQEEYAGRQVVAERIMMRMHCAIMTIKGLLYEGPSPYRHNQFPFTPIWGYRRGRDGLPYGVIRGLRDVQMDINKRASKALYILSTNKVIMDEGAVEDIEEFRREIARPDAIIEKRPGKDLALNVDRELAPAHLDLMSRNIAMIQQIGGVTDEQMGRTTNAVSGAAITARQEQGAMSTSKLFDNLRYSFAEQGAKQLSLIEQFMTEEKQLRITNQRGNPEFVQINDGMPENDIIRQKADFVISEGDWRATIRAAQSEMLLEMMTRMPAEVGMAMLDLVVETMDLPNRDELVSRIRQINGQSDPDADPESPEEQQKAMAAQEQAQMQAQLAEAELRYALARAGKTEAEVQKIMADAQRGNAALTRDNIGAQQTAVETAVRMMENRHAVPVADTILREAGFISRSEQEAQAQQQAMLEQQQAEQQMMEQQQAEQQMMEQQAMQEQGMMQEQQGAMPEQPM
jgi:hypothetical protein